MISVFRLLPVMALLFSVSAISAENMSSHHRDMSMSTPASAEQPLWQGEGVVKKVTDRQITLSHQAIEALNWPAMTMAFDRPAQTETPLAVGDKVAFTFTQTASGYQLVRITPLQ